MWQILVYQVGILWIVLVFLATAGLLALAAVFIASQQRQAQGSSHRLAGLRQAIDALEGCQFANLDPVAGLVDEKMNPEFQTPFIRLVEDSHQIFGSVWIPEPKERLPLPDILPPAVRTALRRSNGSALLMGGVAATVLALSSGYSLFDKLLDASLLRLLAVLPLVVSALGMLLLFHLGDRHYQAIRQAWQGLMISMSRRLPVYSQAAETAILINQMKSYDARMADSVQVLADQVQNLASGKLTDAVSGAVKYVMAATVAPAVIRSTESLASLAQELERQQKVADSAVVRLYSELESRQQRQAELWHKRYQEISEVLAEQQGTFLKGLATGQQQLVDDLGRSQTFALERIVDEQKQTLQHMNNVAQKSWTILQEKLTLIINQLADGQQRLLTGLNEQQQQTLGTIAASSTKSSEDLQTQYRTILDQLQKAQTDIWQQQNDNAKQAYDALVTSQKSSFIALAEQQQQMQQRSEKVQQDGLQQIQASQEAALKQLTDSQGTLLSEIDRRQQESLQAISSQQTQSLTTISSQQAQALQTISSQQAQALKEMNVVQNKTLDGIRKTQEDTITTMVRQQQEALQQVADRFSGEVSGTLAGYLEPLTSRLQVAADSLIDAQAYAKDVKDVIKLQRDQAATLQDSIRDLFAQLIETRQAMSEDLNSLKASSGIMSKSADVMSSVYAGSQSGLSEAISQMSNDLMRLSNVLGSVMATSAEQTRLIQAQSMETYEVNQKHLDAVRGQIGILSDELSTRIEQLMIGFTRLTEDLVTNIDKSINTQNTTLGSSLSGLTEIMGNEARSMSLFAQQINMDIDTLNETLRSAVSDFDQGMRQEMTSILAQFDHEISDVVKRLAQSAGELGDAVEALPAAMRQAAVTPTLNTPGQTGPFGQDRRG